MRTATRVATVLLTAALALCAVIASAQSLHYGEYFELHSTLNANQSHEYYANNYIDLNPGFLSEPNTGNSSILQIDPYFNIDPGYGQDVWMSPDHPWGIGGGKVGSIPMDFKVNENGAATINIPLEFPEGINGMAPNLSLDYNSQGGDGILGLGWSLGGMSKISRVPYTYLYNDSCNAVLFSDNDEWSLDGNRLRKGSDDKYYPEIYDYSVLSYSNEGFTMLKRNGIVCEYKAPYYLQNGPGSLQKPIEWHISKMQDPYGNAIEFTYCNDRVNGGFFPDTIKYTCREGMEPAYTIVFGYATRENTPRKYFSSKVASNAYNSGFSRVSRALTSIACIHDGHKISEYVLEYSNVGIWYDKGLSRIRKYGYYDSRAIGEMLSTTVFEWDGTYPSLRHETAGPPLSFQTDNSQYIWQQAALFPARFEDSLYSVIPDKHVCDIVHLQKAGEGVPPNYILTIYRNASSFSQPNGEWYYSYLQYDCASVNTSLSDGREIFAFMPADTDGDGLNEIVCVYGNRNNNGIHSLGFCLIRKEPDHETFYIQQINITAGNPELFGDFAVLDFDGDGRSDLFCTYGNNIIVYPSREGHPFDESIKIVCDGTTPVLTDNRKIVIGDFFGNKKDQILVMEKISDTSYRTKVFSGCHRPSPNGQGLLLPAVGVNINLGKQYYDMSEEERNLHFNWGDFNGDGKKDALVMLDNRWLFYFSKGNGQFADSVSFTGSSIVNDTFIDVVSHHYHPMVHVADFDHDGCDDLSVSRFRFFQNFGPNNDNWIYAGICRRDYLIRPKDGLVDVKRVMRLDDGGNDIVIDSLKWNPFDANDTMPITTPSGPYYNNPYLACVGVHKGTSDSEILYSRLTDNRKLVLHVSGSLDDPPSNVISKIVDGLGATTEIQYRPHSFQMPFLGSLNGIPDIWRSTMEKVVPYHGFLNVVQIVKQEMKDAENGQQKSFRENKYDFKEAKYHTQGRGFLGFLRTWHRTQGEDNMKDLQTTVVYNVDSNRGIMTPRSIINYKFQSNGIPVVYDSSYLQYAYTEDFPSALGNIPSGGSGKVFAPYLSSTVRIRNDGSPQRYEKTVTVRDGYGNTTSFERRFGNNSTSFPYFEKTTASFDNNVSSSRWIIGVPKNETVTQRLTSSSSDQVVRHTSYQNDTVHGVHLSRTTEPDTDKQLVETYGYDVFGNLVSTTRDIGDGHPRNETCAYSTDGRFLASRTNAMGHTTHYYHRATTGVLDSVTDPNGLTTKYQYDVFLNPTKTEHPSGVIEEQCTRWTCNVDNPHPDAPGHGTPIYFVWSKRSGEKERTTFYDQHRRKLREVDLTMDGKKAYVDYHYHDVTGLLDRVSAPYYPEENETPQFTTYLYDYLERNTRITRPDGAFSSHSFLGQRDSIKDFDGLRRTAHYNPAGLATMVSDHGTSGNSPVGIEFVRYGDGKVKTSKVGGNDATTVTYTYDANRNPATVTDPSLGQLTYEYNGFGELTHSATPRDTATYGYDALGRMTTRTGLDGHSHWQYDQGFIGAVSQTYYNPVEGPDVSECFTYDRLGRPTRHSQHVGAMEEFVFEYGYDAVGHRNAVTFPSGRKFKWHYDRNGFLERVADATGNTDVWRATATDRWGNITGFTEGGIGVNRSYDPVTGLATGISARKDGQPLFGQACSWTDTGNLEWRTDTTLNLREEFTYDRFNRLASSTISDLPGTLTNISEVYQFDNNGNITEKDEVGVYAYEHATNPYAVTELSPDPSIIDRLADQAAAYTPFDKISSVSQDGDTLTVHYGIDRQRVSQSFHDGKGTRTKRHFTPMYETVTENGVTKKLHYLTAANGLFAIFVGTANGGAMYYTLKDHQGSLAATVHGNAVERLSYDPWGRRRNPSDFGYDNVTHTFDRGYTLHEHYDGFDLVNMNGRLYDPILGRMLSPDVVIQDEQNSQAYNRYSYCFNNPLRFSDPSGYVVTIPPDFEKYYMPQYLDDFETYKSELEKLDAQNVSFNTELSEGKSVTILSWTLGDDSYQMTIVDHGLKDYEQMCENSCVAAALAAQEARFTYGNHEITEEWLMSTDKNAYKNGLYVHKALHEFNKKSFVYRRSSYKSKENFSDYEDHAYREMKDDNGIFFRFEGIHGHVVNASVAIEFLFNNEILNHEIRVWDAGKENGQTAGFRPLDFYDQPDKLSHKMGILIHKRNY